MEQELARSPTVRGRMTRAAALRLGAGALAGGASALLAACGALPAGGRGDVPARSKGPVTLELWHAWDGTREPLFSQMYRTFEQLNPTIKAQGSVVPDNVRTEKFLGAAAAGTPPDANAITNNEMPGLALRAIDAFWASAPKAAK